MNPRLQTALNSIISSMNQEANKTEAESAKQNPLKHKLSQVVEGKLRYRYYSAGKDKRGRTIHYCYATVKNVAGYYLVWREVITPIKRNREAVMGDRVATIKRDQWASRKLRRDACALAKKRARASINAKKETMS